MDTLAVSDHDGRIPVRIGRVLDLSPRRHIDRGNTLQRPGSRIIHLTTGHTGGRIKGRRICNGKDFIQVAVVQCQSLGLGRICVGIPAAVAASHRNIAVAGQADAGLGLQFNRQFLGQLDLRIAYAAQIG